MTYHQCLQAKLQGCTVRLPEELELVSISIDATYHEHWCHHKEFKLSWVSALSLALIVHSNRPFNKFAVSVFFLILISKQDFFAQAAEKE